MTTTENVKSDAAEYPAWWDWSEDGPELKGYFLDAGKGFTANGERAFVVLDVDGTRRTLWLHHKVLAAIFAREIQRRPNKQITVGERIEIWCLGEREGDNGRTYTNYRASFPDGPQDSQADIFGLPPELANQFESAPSTEPGTSGGGGVVDDDIPFQPE